MKIFRIVRSTVSVIAVTAIVVATVPFKIPTVSANAVTNPGAETNTTGWNTSGSYTGVTLTRDTTVSYAGSASFRLDAPAGITNADAVMNDSPNYITSSVGGTCTANAWVKGSVAGMTAKIRQREYTPAGVNVGSASLMSLTLPDTDWHQVAIVRTGVTAGNAIDLNIYAYRPSAGQSLWVDEISLDCAIPNTSPMAALTVTPNSTMAPVDVTADASASTDPENNISTYTFDFGDSTTVGPQAGSSATHTYTTAGTYTVVVTVTDTGGLTSATGKSVIVKSNQATNTGAETNTTGWNTSGSYTGTTLTRDTTVNHSGSASFRLDAPTGITNADIVMNDSPNYVTSASGNFCVASAWVKASASGMTAKIRQREYNPSSVLVGTSLTSATLADTDWHEILVVRNGVATGNAVDLNIYGYRPTAGQSLYVDDIKINCTNNNSAPVADLTVTPSTGVAPVAVTASASASTDADSNIVSYTFDFGDGSAVVGPQSGNTATHTYTTVGSYSATVTVTDFGGLTGTSSKTVTPTGTITDSTIVAAGDVACAATDSVGTNSCHQAATASLIGSINPDVVMPIGDLEYGAWCTAAGYTDNYGPNWGAYKSITRPTPGNHEYNPTDPVTDPTCPSSGYVKGTGYFDYFNGTGVTSGAAGDRTKGYYKFTTGAWTVYVLNTNVSAADGSAQETWFKNDLATAGPTACQIVTWHQPRWSSGPHGSDGNQLNSAKLWEDAANAGVEIVLNGHDHDYERFKPMDASGAVVTEGGTRSFVVGTGGKQFYSFGTLLSQTDVLGDGVTPARQNNTFGVLKLSLHSDNYSWNFVPEAGKTFSDSGSATCNGVTPPPPPTPVTRYVDKNNSSCSNTGTGTATVPFCSIAAGTAATTLAGDTLIVKAGTYSENLTVPISGNSTNQTTIKAADGETVTLTGAAHGITISGKAYVTVSGFTVTGTTGDGISVATANHLVISNNTVTNAGTTSSGQTARGAALTAVTDSTISGNNFSGNSNSGLYIGTGSTGNLIKGNQANTNAAVYDRLATGIDIRAAGNTIDSNVTHNNEDTGIQLYGGSDNSLVINNITYDNGDHGIDCLNATGQRIFNNTVFHNVTAGINLEGTTSTASSNGTVKNNIAANNGISSPRTTSNIRVDANSISGTVVNYNHVYLSSGTTMYVWGASAYSTQSAFRIATSQEANGTEGNPLFTNTATGDFSLQAGSPAIDSADSSVTGFPTLDALGVARRDDTSTTDTGNGTPTYAERGALEY